MPNIHLPESLSALEQPWMQALVVAASSFLLAFVVVWVLKTWILRLTRHTASTVDDILVARVRTPVFLSIFSAGLHGALAILLEEDQARLFTILVDSIRSIVLISWLVFALTSFRLILQALGSNPNSARYFEAATLPLFDNIGKVLFVLIAGYFACLIWNINPAALLTSAGIAGIALGFAAKDTLANLFAGIFILADVPYKIGDMIALDSGDRGVVTHIGLRSTRILTLRNIEIVIPNSIIANSKVTNESGGPSVRSSLSAEVGVAYGSDVDKVCAVLERVGMENPNLCKDPKPVARFKEFGDSSLNFALYAQFDDPRLRGLYIHELNVAIFKAFAAEGIEIPFPQRDLHIRSGADKLRGE